jgi:hypothetical protein
MVLLRSFTVAKAGNAEAENEDAYLCHSSQLDGEFLLAVADGATDSLFSGIWARLLVKGIPTIMASRRSRKRLSKAFRRWIHALQASWVEEVSTKSLPWYAEHKLATGAHAALIGVRVCVAETELHWEALAVGDCNVFVVEDDELRVGMPIQKAEDFGMSPFLIGTTEAANARLRDFLVLDAGSAGSSAEFFVMSDALAHWFLAATERKQRPWRVLRKLSSDVQFRRFVGRLRSRQWMRNDDTTIIMLRT